MPRVGEREKGREKREMQAGRLSLPPAITDLLEFISQARLPGRQRALRRREGMEGRERGYQSSPELCVFLARRCDGWQAHDVDGFEDS